MNVWNLQNKEEKLFIYWKRKPKTYLLKMLLEKKKRKRLINVFFFFEKISIDRIFVYKSSELLGFSAFVFEAQVFTFVIDVDLPL